MKNEKMNGNNKNIGSYYLGLDVGTNSVGWAVTDKSYNVLKFKGNAMWGVRLFEEAQDASARRSSRTARRRLDRRNQRLLLLQGLFANAITEIDPQFFLRMQESALHEEDKTGSRFSLFAGDSYNDKTYHKQYPTVYHLRRELAASKDAHDVRLVYLALHHIVKSRGHFLYETSDSGDDFASPVQAFAQLQMYLEKEYACKIEAPDEAAFVAVLCRNDMGITAKKKALKGLFEAPSEKELSIDVASVCDMLAGASVAFAALFCDEELKQAEVKSFSLKNSLDDNFDALSTVLGDRMELLLQLKRVYDAAKLSQILDGKQSISEAKIALYEKNRKDLSLLKKYVRKTAPGSYKRIFAQKAEKLNNLPAYNQYKSKSGDYACSQEDFCKFLKKELPVPDASDAELCRIFREIQDASFLPRLRGSDNGVIPYQLHKRELLKILENASTYLPFLNETDADGFTVKEKIVKVFEFRIPYYVGPLSCKHPNHWVVRFAGKEHEKVYPWNFESIVDTEASADAFMANLIGKCTYTGEKVLPKDSLLYSEFAMRNEMNLLRVNGHPLPENVKQELLQHFFYDASRKVTKKQIWSYLRGKGLIAETDELSGIDDTVKTTLRSFHDFRDILSRVGDYDMVEEIIRSILVFGEDKRMLRRWLQKNTHDLTDEDYKHICRLRYKDWGRLSETLLTGLKDEQGKNVITYLRKTDKNLMQILAEYGFGKLADAHRTELLGGNRTLADKLEEMYVSPMVRRSLRQALRIVDEIVDIRRSAPEKIFIEMARGDKLELKGKRTESRKSKLQALYAACKEESAAMFAKLEKEDDNSLRSDKLYLYYLQMGKCMYSGDPIDLDALLHGEKYDIDHIFPRSRVKDNSLDNRVLVRSELNREKTNTYPIGEDIRKKMLPLWQQMKKQGLISPKKFDRLTRSYPLTEKELSDFVARQLTETQQSTKALATLLQNINPDIRIVYSKAGNVSDFRHEFDMLKCRDINDLHHAKDAYLNIVVGNVYDTKFTSRFFANIHRENYSLNKVFAFDTPGAWDKTETIKTVKKWMAKNNVLVTRMPREVKGQLFDLQLMPAGKGQVEKKQGLSVEKYGGYNKRAGAYFCVVEYTDKKKRVLALQPVYVYKKSLYESDPVRYCTEELGLREPKVIAKKIRMDALLELDGKRLLISGRTGERLLCKHTYQLAMDSNREKYIRSISKYVERCAARKAELPVTEHDGLTAEGNRDLYDWFLKKCDQNVYADLFKNMKADMVQHRDKFEAMSILEQAKLLLEILKAFKCNAQNPDFSSLCGKGKVAILLEGMNITKRKSAFLINQSVTGLFETKTDLMR